MVYINIMSSGYQHMSILECSHASSEEGKSGNNENLAMYHNKLGTGVKLNVGDTISVDWGGWRDRRIYREKITGDL